MWAKNLKFKHKALLPWQNNRLISLNNLNAVYVKQIKLHLQLEWVQLLHMQCVKHNSIRKFILCFQWTHSPQRRWENKDVRCKVVFLMVNCFFSAQRGGVQTKVRWAEWQIAAGVEDCEGSRSLTVRRRMHDEMRDACSLGKFEVFSKNKIVRLKSSSLSFPWMKGYIQTGISRPSKN